MKIISKFSLLILLASVLVLLVTGNFFSSSPFVIAGQLAAVALSIWARQSFQRGQFSINAEPVKHKSLLKKGPYHFIRHPMYAAALLLLWSTGLGHLGWIPVIIALIDTVVIAIRIRNEERLLRRNYYEYIFYTRETKRIIPFVF